MGKARCAAGVISCLGVLGGTMLAAPPAPPVLLQIPGSGTPMPQLGALHFSKPGNAANEEFGYGMAVVGDLNGDGRDDVLVSSGGIDTCFLVSGRDGSILRILTDPGIYSGITGFGTYVAATGDVNGDGVPDMSVGTEANGLGSPAVYVIDGRTGGLVWSKRLYYGAAKGVGDLTGDGKWDVVIEDFSGGRVRAYRGDTGMLLWTWATAGIAPGVTGMMGDVSGDGIPDVAVAEVFFGNSNKVVVLSGADGTKVYDIQGPTNTASYFGFGIGAPGDLGGDGEQDLLIGDLGHNGPAGQLSGRIYHYSGVTLVETWDGSAPATFLGREIRVAGDANGDGYNDFLSMEQGDAVSGRVDRVLLFSGKTGHVLHRFAGEAIGDRFGYSLGRGANFNGDRFSDLVIAAPGRTEGGIADAGKVYFYLGGYGQ